MNDEAKVNPAFCWYGPEEWLKTKKTAVDAEKQDDTYGEWKANANKAISGIRAAGHDITKKAMKSNRFFAWCKENKYETRPKFTAEKSEERRRET